jgi:probable phosphoglycerate mutase
MFESTLILAIRHGQTAWNAGLRMQGQLDIPLDETGYCQAARLGRALASEKLAAIYSSDLQRAVSTAQAVAAATGAPIRPERALRERSFGCFEGHTYAEIEVRWPADFSRWRSREPGFGPAGGESLNVFSQRCVTAVLALAARHPGETIAVVAHGGVLDCLYRAAVGIALDAPRGWQLDNATINRLLFNGDGIALVGWNDRAHLEADPGPFD